MFQLQVCSSGLTKVDGVDAGDFAAQRLHDIGGHRVADKSEKNVSD